MATGFLANAACYASSSEAVLAYWSSQPVSVVPITGATNGTFIVHYLPSGASFVRVTDRCIQSSTTSTCTRSTTAVPTFTPAACTIQDATSYDYNTLGQVWAFAVSVILLAYVLGRSAGVVISIFRK